MPAIDRRDTAQSGLPVAEMRGHKDSRATRCLQALHMLDPDNLYIAMEISANGGEMGVFGKHLADVAPERLAKGFHLGRGFFRKSQFQVTPDTPVLGLPRPQESHDGIAHGLGRSQGQAAGGEHEQAKERRLHRPDTAMQERPALHGAAQVADRTVQDLLDDRAG